MSGRSIRVGLLAVALTASACTQPQVCKLGIVAPADGMLLGPKDDVSNEVPGLQVDVTVSASGLDDGTPVQLSANGGSPSVGVVAGGQVVFSFTLVPDQEGHVAIVASAQGGSCQSAPVVVTIPVGNFVVAITDPPDGFDFGQEHNQNKDPMDSTFLYDVVVATTAPSGMVALSINGQAQSPALVAEGRAVFPAAVLPPGNVKLLASISDSLGNSAISTVSGMITTHPPPCSVVGFTPGVATVKGIPTPVLNVSVDEDLKKPGEQTEVIALTSPGSSVSLFVDGMSRGSQVADTMGDVTFDGQTIPEGAHEVQARCVDLSLAEVSSPKIAVFVDSIAPTCMLAAPMAHTVVSATDDVDMMKAGVQITATLQSPSPDAEGQPASFGCNGVDQGAPAVAITGGAASHEVTLTSPGRDTDNVTGTVADSAGNVCIASAPVGLDAMGCALLFLRPAPLPPPKHPPILVQDDTEPPITDGLQYDVALAVDKACVGRKVHFTVAGMPISPDAPVVLDGGQKLGARADFPSAMVCPPGVNGAPPACDGIFNFFASVTDGQGVATGASLDVLVSAVPPTISLNPAPPMGNLMPLHCGDSLTAAYDVDQIMPGVQLVMAATTTSRLLEVHVRGPAGELVYPPQTLGSLLSTVTLGEGFNQLSAIAIDMNGNQGESNDCQLSLQGLNLAITTPTDGSFVPAGGVAVSGTVSIPGAAITLFVDGNQLASTTAVGNNWTFPKAMIPAGKNRILRADAVGGGHGGSVSITITSDGQRPSGVVDLAATMVSRAAVQLGFTAPFDDNPPVASYDLRTSPSAITATNFPMATAIPSGMPGLTGVPQTATASKLHPGLPAWFALVSVDRAGNRSDLSNVISATPTFSRQLVTPPTDGGELSGKRSFGAAAASGDFNGDGFADLAVGAPSASYSGMASGEGAVYLWYGAMNGLGATPDLVLRGASPGAHAGSALTAGDYNGDGKSDLVVAAPDLKVNDKNMIAVAVGGAYLFEGGGAGLAKSMMPRALTAADSLFTGDPDDPTMAGARFGASLATARFDPDALDDLVLGAPGAQSGAGAAFVLAGAMAMPPSLRAPKDLESMAARGWRLLCANFPMASGYGDFVAGVGPLQGPGDMTGEIAVSSTGSERVAIFAAPMNGVDVDGATAALALLRDSGAPGLGTTVAGLPDSDGNQFGELLLGEPLSVAGAGRIAHLDGSKLPGGGAVVDLTVAATYPFVGGAGDALGASVAPAIDLDGDGALDLAFVSAGKTGQLHTVYGPSPFGMSAAALFPAAMNATAARTLVLLGDLDKDGLPELLLTDPTQNNGAGRIELYR